MPSLPSSSPSTFTLRSKRLLPLRSVNRRGTLRDLYTFGLVSVFRRDSILRVWEPLRETPRRPDESET